MKRVQPRMAKLFIGVLISSKDELQFAFWSEHVGAPAGCPCGLLQGAAVGVVCALTV